MTFAAWYDATVKPQLEETLKTMPVSAREALRTASRQAMAACWNAALDSAQMSVNFDLNERAPYDLRALKVTP